MADDFTWFSCSLTDESDFIMPDGGIEIMFGPHLMLEQCVHISIVDDLIAEPVESFTVILSLLESSDGVSTQLASPEDTTVTINDDGE